MRGMRDVGRSEGAKSEGRRAKGEAASTKTAGQSPIANRQSPIANRQSRPSASEAYFRNTTPYTNPSGPIRHIRSRVNGAFSYRTWG